MALTRQLHAVVSIGHVDALPADAVVNNFSFQGDDVESVVDNCNAIKTKLLAFYGAMDEYWPSWVDTTNIRLKVYDRADPPPLVPVHNSLMGSLTNGGSTGLPSEVACVLSFAAAIDSGDIPARHRGRIYFGPIATAAADTTGNKSRPVFSTGGFADDLAAAGDALAVTGDTVPWGVRSELDDVTRPVVTGWVDNAWDIQRRRGLDPTARKTF